MMHPKQVLTKRAHTCSSQDNEGGCTCGNDAKRPVVGAVMNGEGGGNGSNGGGGNGEESNSLFSLVTVAEQQRQAQEQGGAIGGSNGNGNNGGNNGNEFRSGSMFSLSSSAPAIATHSSIFPPAGMIPLKAHHHMKYTYERMNMCIPT